MTTPKQKQLMTSALLLAVCIGFWFLFGSIREDYCKECDENNIHIIDVHVRECKFYGLFDGPYVAKAAKFYDKEKYKGSYLFIDSLFPLAYSAFLLSLSYGLRKRRWYRWVLTLIVLGALLDYGENFSFLSYLSAATPGKARVVAAFTTLKTLLFCANGAIAIFLLVKYLRSPGEERAVVA